MINIRIQYESMEYEVKELIKLFTLDFVINDDSKENDIKTLEITEVIQEDKKLLRGIYIDKSNDDKFQIEDYLLETDSKIESKKELKRLIKVIIYKIMSKLYQKKFPWGILTGIRPTKIVHEMMEKNISNENIFKVLKDQYLLSEDKISLLIDVALTERKFVYPIEEKKISVYVSIPFCPTRCLYCSFPSHILSKWGHLKKDYLEALNIEIQETGKILAELDFEIETLYIGGGTPTTLTSDEMEFLIKSLKQNLDLSKMKEFTVEAGRPDTIDIEKLTSLKKMGVQRISINPQTMNDSTLLKIGRSHNTDDIKEIYSMARKIGFDNINMDIILGLPDETPEMVENTLKEIVKLNPESLTVHTMAIKRASKLNECIEEYELSKYNDMVDMINISSQYAQNIGMKPYYMYRQKYMLGNLENIGYCKEGFECIYNIQIMEEKQTIIALGAGGVSKICYPSENRIERIPNVKNIEHYIPRVKEMIERKAKELLKEE